MVSCRTGIAAVATRSRCVGVCRGLQCTRCRRAVTRSGCSSTSTSESSARGCVCAGECIGGTAPTHRGSAIAFDMFPSTGVACQRCWSAHTGRRFDHTMLVYLYVGGVHGLVCCPCASVNYMALQRAILVLFDDHIALIMNNGDSSSATSVTRGFPSDEPMRTDDDIIQPLTLYNIASTKKFYRLLTARIPEHTSRQYSSSMCKKATCTDCGMSTSYTLVFLVASLTLRRRQEILVGMRQCNSLLRRSCSYISLTVKAYSKRHGSGPNRR